MVLVPVAITYFPIPIAIALAAIVHLVSNLYKLGHLWRKVDIPITLCFGFPALLAAIPGALLVTHLAQYGPLLSYDIGLIYAEITPLKIVVGSLLIFFATAEWLPCFQRLHPSKKLMPIGGFLSGFSGVFPDNRGSCARHFFQCRAG